MGGASPIVKLGRVCDRMPARRGVPEPDRVNSACGLRDLPTALRPRVRRLPEQPGPSKLSELIGVISRYAPVARLVCFRCIDHGRFR